MDTHKSVETQNQPAVTSRHMLWRLQKCTGTLSHIQRRKLPSSPAALATRQRNKRASKTRNWSQSLDNQRYQRNVRKKVWESLRMPQLIQSMRIVGTPWCRCNQSETATCCHKFKSYHSESVWIHMDTHMSVETQNQPAVTSRHMLWRLQKCTGTWSHPCSAQTAAQHFDLLFKQGPKDIISRHDQAKKCW